MDELQMTVETLIDLDEPEALLATLQRAAARQKGERWDKLALALTYAQDKLAEWDPKHDPANESLPLEPEAKAE
jgi:hypothetical protein